MRKLYSPTELTNKEYNDIEDFKRTSAYVDLQIQKDIVVEVKEEDIANGVKQNEEFCPIAIAIRRKTKSLMKIVVHERGIQLYKQFHEPQKIIARRQYAITEFAPAIKDFIQKFDAGKSVEPMSFLIPDVPIPMIK